ncbi:MAG: PQQ-binding-like beta-propeller repeat protein [Anaerolineae bacterium]|nr:PQQ-binding-like beta-propeller repeat protein [Anaerolineae bacterium]
MKTKQEGLQAISGNHRTQRSKSLGPKWIGLAILVIISLTGCGRRVPATWPGLSVQNGIVYLVNSQVYALEADTGNLVWDYPDVPQRSGGLLGGCSAPQPTDGPFTAAPVAGQDFVFLASGGEQQQSLWGKGENMAGLRALNEFGTLQWTFKEPTKNAVAAPAIMGQTVYLASSDHNVYAVDIDTREARWIFETGNWVWATPLPAGNTVYVASMDHILYALDDETGRVKWTFEHPSSALPTAPTLAQDTLYLNALDGYVYAVDAETGKLVWEQKVQGSIWGTPLVQDGLVYVGTLDGVMIALNAQNGQTVWTAKTEGEMRGTPAYVNGSIYIGCENGKLYVFDAQTGAESASPLGETLDKVSIFTSPVFDGQYLYIVATDGTVFALDPEENMRVWQKNPLTDQEAE